MSFYKEFQCCNVSNMILPKDITFTDVPDEQKNLNNSDIIVNDEYIEIPYLVKFDRKESFIPSIKSRLKSISWNESLNTTFSEVPTNIETTEPNLKKISSLEFNSVKLEQHEPHQAKKLSKITKMRKYLLDNSF